MKVVDFEWDCTDVSSRGSNSLYSSIGSDNGLAPTRRQGIIWTNDGKFADVYVTRPQWVEPRILPGGDSYSKHVIYVFSCHRYENR